MNCLFIRKGTIEDLRAKFPHDIRKLRALAFFRYKHFLYQKHHYQQQGGIREENPRITNNEQLSESSLQILQTHDIDNKQVDLNSPPEPNSGDQNTAIHLLASPDRPEKGNDIKNLESYIQKGKSHKEKQNQHKVEAEPEPDIIPMLSPSRRNRKKKGNTKTFDKLLSLDESDIELAENSSASEIEDYLDDVSDGSQQDMDHEEVVDYENEEEEDDPDKLNSSDIYPLETNSTFSDALKADEYLEYLQVNKLFLQNFVICNSRRE